MDPIVESIRAALVPGASPEVRSEGAAACRAVLAALDTASGDPTSEPGAAPSEPGTADAAAFIAQLVRVPAEHRVDLAIDLAIGKLRTMLPDDAPPIEVRSLRFPLVPLGAHRGVR